MHDNNNTTAKVHNISANTVKIHNNDTTVKIHTNLNYTEALFHDHNNNVKN